MDDYMSEYRNLLNWFFSEMDEVDKIPYGKGLDGEHATAQRNLGNEYRRRLRALKQKYGKE